MAYTVTDYKTKKALKEDLLAGKRIAVYQPGPFSDRLPSNGVVYLEGPHYPRPHTWYAKGVLRDGVLIQVDSTKAPAGHARHRAAPLHQHTHTRRASR